MKFIICDSTHYFKLDSFLENYKNFLAKTDYEIVSLDEALKELNENKELHFSDAFDYKTTKGCMIEISRLNQLESLSKLLDNEYFFIDMKSHLIVITAYYPDD